MDIRIGDAVTKPQGDNYIFGIVINILSGSRGLSEPRRRSYYTVEWAHPDYPLEDMIETAVIIFYRKLYIDLLTRGFK